MLDFSTSFATDTAFFNGRCRHSQIVLPTPESAREVPCDGCPSADRCAAIGTECVAFRNWSASGDFRDADIERLLRVPRNLR